MWTKNIQHIISPEAAVYSYNGIPIYCAQGVHEKVFSLIEKKIPQRDASILVLGAGAGAFDERLFDAGYTNITAVEFRKEIYTSKGKIIEKDLNSDFSDLGKFDCVVAIEIIEHLENHFQFIRNIDSVTNTGGKVFVTSPNTENTLSRVKFLLKGDLDFFNRDETEKTGHINPVSLPLFLFSVKNSTKLSLEEISHNTPFWNLTMYPTLLIKLIVLCVACIHPFLKNKSEGQINILSFTKNA